MINTLKYTFTKDERLCNPIALDSLYKNGKSVFSYPFKFVYHVVTVEQSSPVKIVISIPKRSFKHAVKRNLLRRRAKEAYRLNKAELYNKLQNNNITLHLMLIYVDKEVKDYSTIEKGVKKGITKLLSKVV